jgi:hypothetical protein
LVYQWKPEWFGRSDVDRAAAAPVPTLPPPVDPAAADAVALQRWIEITGSAPEAVVPGEVSGDCESIERAWRRTCDHLDARFPTGGSFALSVELIDEFSRSRPTVGGELLEHATMLQNAFHLFRVVGAERLVYLSQMLQQEELLEPASHAFYRWISASERCAKRGEFALSAADRSEYAAFLYQTLGGQAYLRRRAPRAEALACYYAIHAIDLAQRSGQNGQGYDPRREIPRCRELLSGKGWILGPAYSETLERISTAWEPR